MINFKVPSIDFVETTFNNEYQKKWESRSSVRSRPRKVIDFSQEGYFFPEGKQPLLLNQDVINLGSNVSKEILLQSFFKYLNDIINLEINLINSACSKLLYSDLPLNFTDDIKLNTYTILIDEYYHVYLAKDMLLQLNEYFPNRKKFDYPISDAYHAVKLIKDRIDAKYHDVFEILSVCIFETTLVRELVEFFNSKNIHPSIKYYVNDHMNDESRHYKFFYDLISYIWDRLPDDYKENIGIHFGDFIRLYLNVESDKAFNKIMLDEFLKDEGKANNIISELYKGFDITPEIPIVKNVINVFKETGLLDFPSVKSGFLKIGWDL